MINIFYEAIWAVDSKSNAVNYYWYLAIPAIVSRRRVPQDFEPVQCQLPWRDTGQSLELKLLWLWLQRGGGGRTTYGHIYGMEVIANHKCARVLGVQAQDGHLLSFTAKP